MSHRKLRLLQVPTTESAAVGWCGVKAVGLARLPPSATPPFTVLPAEVYRAWLPDKDVRAALGRCGSSAAQLAEDASRFTGGDILLRSSATDELILDRGRYESLPADLADPAAVEAGLQAIFSHYATHGGGGSMAIILQQRVSCELFGHLSNEHRVADKPYRWRVEMASHEGVGHERTFNISAKQAADLNLDEPLRLTNGRMLRKALSGLAKWAWRQAPAQGIDRSALEWGWDGARLWVFQWDAVQDDQDVGIDPRNDPPGLPSRPQLEDGVVFRRHVVGAATPWPKLMKLADFATGETPPPHRIFCAPADRVVATLATPSGGAELAHEMEALTAGRGVMRTDMVRGGFDLPKTDTVTGGEAVRFLRRTLNDLRKAGVDLREYAFLLHQYIVARAAAWSYHRQGSNFVYVDGLWGLADGMQYLDCDTFVYDLRLGREVSATLRYKAKILREHADGSWRYDDVKGGLARQRSLSLAAVSEIAKETAKIAVRVGEPAQVMWFCGLPSVAGLGENLPWYRADPQQELTERQARSLRPYVVRSVDDLDRLDASQSKQLKIVLDPAVEDVRNPEFLEAVAARCGEVGLPVEMRGSILSHAYHQLRALGVDVYSAEPTKRPAEIRQRKAFDKLVRDAIPSNIAAKGEAVRTYRLANADRRRALTAKLVEEAEEFLLAEGEQAIKEELADLFELVQALAANGKFDMAEIAQIAAAKRGRRGGFEGGVMLSETATRVIDDSQALFPEGRSQAADGPIRALDSAERASDPGPAATLPVDRLLGVQAANLVQLSNPQISVKLRVSLKQGRFTIELVASDHIAQDRLI